MYLASFFLFIVYAKKVDAFPMTVMRSVFLLVAYILQSAEEVDECSRDPQVKCSNTTHETV